MLTNEQHADLNNKMSPILNYFKMLENLDEIPENKRDEFEQLLNKQKDVCFENIPLIEKILKK